MVPVFLAEPDALDALLEHGGCSVHDRFPPSKIARRSAEHGDDAAMGVEEGNGKAVMNEIEEENIMNEERTFQANQYT